MTSEPNALPSKSVLWRGVLLGTIAQAIRVMGDLTFTHEQSWDPPNYSVQNSMGARGTITFAHEKVVGVFFDEDSPRNPFATKAPYSLGEYTQHMPLDIEALAQQEALQYVLEDTESGPTAIITSAFWSTDDRLVSFEPWEQVLSNGAHIVELQFLEAREAIPRWQETYDFTDIQTDLLIAIFERRSLNVGIPIQLSNQERQAFISKGDEGYEDARDLLAAIGIEL
jgi:hypothetical protein